MGRIDSSLSSSCFHKREVTIFFDLATWAMNQGHLSAEITSILNEVQRKKCSDVIIRNHQKSIRINKEVTEDDLINAFYTMYQRYTTTESSQMHINAIPKNMPNIIASDDMSKKTKHTFFLFHYIPGHEWHHTLKKLQGKGYDIVIASAASGFVYSNDYFDWLPKHRFVFLSVGAQHGDKFLGKTQSKTITDLLVNPNFDRFEFSKSSYRSESLNCLLNPNEQLKVIRTIRIFKVIIPL